jgi:hypothetical protein
MEPDISNACNATLAQPESYAILPFGQGFSMDSRVSVRFFTLVPSEAGQASFESCLKKLISLSPNPSRPVDDVTITEMRSRKVARRVSLADWVRLALTC